MGSQKQCPLSKVLGRIAAAPQNSNYGVALHLMADPDSLLVGHTHEYLTGKGIGHNNSVAATTEPLKPPVPEEEPAVDE